MSLFWNFSAFVSAPLGVLLCLLLLSGFSLLEKPAHGVCGLGVKLGPFDFSLSFFFFLFAAVGLGLETYSLHSLSEQVADLPSSVPLQDRHKMNKWRHERNWWIMFLNFVLWFTVWRLSQIIKGFRSKVAAKYAEYKSD